jgi:hypothetical protein
LRWRCMAPPPCCLQALRCSQGILRRLVAGCRGSRCLICADTGRRFRIIKANIRVYADAFHHNSRVPSSASPPHTTITTAITAITATITRGQSLAYRFHNRARVALSTSCKVTLAAHAPMNLHKKRTKCK